MAEIHFERSKAEAIFSDQSVTMNGLKALKRRAE